MMINKNKNKNGYEVNLFIFSKINRILEENPNNNDTQIKIERFLHSQFEELLNNKERGVVLGVDLAILNPKFKEYCFDKVDELSKYLAKNKERLNALSGNKMNSLSRRNRFDLLFKDIVNIVSNNEFIDIMLYTLFWVATYKDIPIYNKGVASHEMYENQTDLLSICLRMGKHIVKLFLKNKFKEFTIINPNISFSSFKDDLISKNESLINEEFYLLIGSRLIEIMKNSDMLELKVVKLEEKRYTILTLSEKVESLLNGNLNIALSVPLNLPMIVKPNPYSDNLWGGYLTNGTEFDIPLFTHKWELKETSKIEKENKVYFVINEMMKTPFKINKELLNYLLEYNHIHKLLIDPHLIHELSNVKRNKYQEREFQKFNSKKLLEQYIIKIAKTFENVPEIFFPIKLDNRGRLYPVTDYLHYQGTGLAKALILFARPDIIQRNDRDAIDYLKAYGATCFGNGLQRKSYVKRVEWVDNNWSKIVYFENSDLLDKAEEKFLFLSFCFEMKKLNNFLQNEYIHEFKTHLPIQLDGTCNGFQHLALLSNETRLFETLNLSEANKKDDPKDFYEHLINQVIFALEEKKQGTIDENVKESIERLLKIGLTRTNIKKAIMTKPYNATENTLIAYIRESLIFDRCETINNDNEIDKKISWYKVDKEDKIYINFKDIAFLVKSLNELLYVNYPKIQALSKYLKDIVKILNKLNLPVVWRLPHGLMVSQKYMQRHSRKIHPFSHLRNSLSLSILDNVKIDKAKQITALMPNLVHSLDAATLALLYTSFYNSVDNPNVNFYSVHDCYGVTAKYVDTLISLLRGVYIHLYSSIGYLKKFDRDIIDLILTSYGEDLCSYNELSRIITINKMEIVLPEIDNLVDCYENKIKSDIKNVNKAIYFIK